MGFVLRGRGGVDTIETCSMFLNKELSCAEDATRIASWTPRVSYYDRMFGPTVLSFASVPADWHTQPLGRLVPP